MASKGRDWQTDALWENILSNPDLGVPDELRQEATQARAAKQPKAPPVRASIERIASGGEISNLLRMAELGLRAWSMLQRQNGYRAARTSKVQRKPGGCCGCLFTAIAAILGLPALIVGAVVLWVVLSRVLV